MITITIGSKPTKSGMYLVKKQNTSYWQALVEIHGEEPFLSIESVIPLYTTFNKNIFTENKLSDLVWSEELMLKDLNE